MGGPKPTVKSFEIDKRLVYGAWEKVRANQGAPGVDTVSITEFADDERNNLYKLWNRMSAGTHELPAEPSADSLPDRLSAARARQLGQASEGRVTEARDSAFPSGSPLDPVGAARSSRDMWVPNAALGRAPSSQDVGGALACGLNPATYVAAGRGGLRIRLPKIFAARSSASPTHAA